MCCQQEQQMLNAVYGNRQNSVHNQNHEEQINKICGKNGVILCAMSGGRYNNHWSLNG